MAYTPTDNPYIPGDPYSYDLKWIVQKVHELLDSMAALNTSQGNLQQSFEDLKQYVMDYFASLDIAAEVSAQIQQLYRDGYFDNIIDDWITRNKVLLLDQDQSATFTDAEKAQARKNIMAGGSNRNLLDNWWFGTGVVNQRGASSGYTEPSKYNIFDRWLTSYGSARGEFSIDSNGITLTSAASTYANIEQKLLNPSMLHGQTLTASVMLSDGTIISGTKVFSSSGNTSFYSANNIQILIGPSGNFVIYVTNGTTRTFKAAKLELGTVSTLANDAPPNYAEELAKCQYYFRRIQASTGIAVGFGFMAAPTSGCISIPATMRTSGAISCAISGSATLRGAGTSGTVTAITVAGHAKEFVRLNATISGSIAGNNPAVLVLDTNTYIDLSADL